MKIPMNRDEDIKLRGPNLKVYDYDRQIVKLLHAKMWYNNDGNYVEPREVENDNYLCTDCVIS